MKRFFIIVTIVVTAFANCATLSAISPENQSFSYTRAKGAALMEAITYIISDITCIPQDEILPESRFTEDLDLDEMDMIDIFNRCEDDFDVVIYEEEQAHIKTVQDLHDVILPKLYEIK